MKKDRILKKRARRMRHEPNPSEQKLWWALRNRQSTFKFRRQQIKGPYILDFYCAEAQLAVELDGESHIGREKEDLARQKWLESQGLKVLRFPNTELFSNTDAVLESIWYWCEQRSKAKAVRPSPRSRPALPAAPPHSLGPLP